MKEKINLQFLKERLARLQNIKEMLKQKLESIQEDKKEKEEIKKLMNAKTGLPITISGYAVLGPNGEDNGKRYPTRKQAEEVASK
jgi:cell shape-determining protein MreC